MRDTIGRLTEKPQSGRKDLQTISLIKDLDSEYIKDPYNLIRRQNLDYSLRKNTCQKVQCSKLVVWLSVPGNCVGFMK